MDAPVLMAVFAHPDDEAFGTGGTLAKYAAEGCQVYLVTATRGESGQIARPELATGANLPLVRERELQCACEEYGIHPPIFLDYVDGQLPLVHQGQAVGKLVRVMREHRPQVVITFGPDGIYGHYDHIAVHRWTTIAAELAADPDCFPGQMSDTCQPHQVSKVYYRVLSERDVAAIAEAGQRPSVDMDGVPFYFATYTEDEITTVLDVSDHVEAKLRGIRCHITQLEETTPFNESLEEARRDVAFQHESFILAQSTVGRPGELETDLLRGIRQITLEA